MNRATQRSVDLFVSAGCSLVCAGLCDCRTRPSDDRWVGKALEGGGSRVTIRGGTADLHVVASMVGSRGRYMRVSRPAAPLGDRSSVTEASAADGGIAPPDGAAPTAPL